METFWITLAAFTIISLIGYVIAQDSGVTDETLAKQENIIREKEANLKAIYASMAEFDKLIIERDNAIKNGDMELYKSKVKEASVCFENGNKLFIKK